MSWSHSSRQGFALPTVVIATVVMLIILVTTVASVTSARASLDVQYREQLMRDAVESGIAHASDCLAAYNYNSTWTNASLLRPNTNCTGGTVCTNAARCFVMNDGRYRTSYEVTAPTDDGSGIQEFSVRANVSLLRASSGLVSSTYTKTALAQVGSQVTSTSVAFGYTLLGTGGAFYGTLYRDGTLRAAGSNQFGQLGNGTVSDTLQPTKFNIPSSNPIVAGFSNFLSAGLAMFALDNTGKVYGAGKNDSGQIGAGTVSSSINTPAQVQIPGARPISSVTVGGATNYFLAADGNLYAAGECDYGRLGSNYTISGCLDRSIPVRVNLPTPNPSDPNTIPTSNIVSDRNTVYVRMSGGRVYGWGDNNMGQLGDPTYNPRSSPVQIGTYGNPSQPRATHIENDGVNIYVVDSMGKMSAMGDAGFGNHGNRTASFYNFLSKRCFNNTNGDGITMAFAVCNGSVAQRFEYRSNGSVYNAATNKCLENTNSDGVNLRLATCNSSTAQTFAWDPNGDRLTNSANGRCATNVNGDGVTLRLAVCSSSADIQHLAMTTTWMSQFNAANLSGPIITANTDQRQVTVLTSDGEVWSAGINTSGMFGNGTYGQYNPDPIQFPLPSGQYGKSIFAANASTPSDYKYQNLMVVTTSGAVYGAGSNLYGQLGNGTTASRQTTPVAMNLINGAGIAAKEVQVGYGTAVIYTTAGIVYTVGNNSNGQLGDGTTNNRSTPYFSRLINQSDPTQY